MKRQNELVLANEGRVLAEVRTGPAATPAEEYAAVELRRHLHAMAGVGPQLQWRKTDEGSASATRVWINDAAAATAAGIQRGELPTEGFRLVTGGGDLHVLGGGPRGVLYGVYELLERFGCRWYTPQVSHIPRRRRIALAPLDDSAAPAFEFRDQYCWAGRDPAWWVRNRLNGWYTPVPEYMGGHVTYGGFVHTFYPLLPPAEFFAEHPEYFSEVGGTRRREGGQLCLTHPEVLRIVAERVLDKMRKNPRTTIFSVSQNDWEGYCECPSCRALAAAEGSQAGPLLHFVNAIAERTSREFPSKLIDTLAYMYTLDAPRQVRPHPNVRIRLCPINCCQGHAFGSCEHPESRRFLKALEAWGKVTSQLYIWHYCTNFSNYPLPMPDLEELHANINLYADRGVYGVFMQGQGCVGGGAESMALRGYVLGRLLWNPRQPLWPLVEEFLAAVYGKAAPAVRGYLECFHRRVREDRNCHPSLYDQPSHPLFDGDILALADQGLAPGERQVRGRQRQEVALLRAGLSYARLGRLQAGAFRVDGDRYVGKVDPLALAELERLNRLWQQAGIEQIREGRPREQSVNMLRSRLAAHPVVWLEDGDNRLAVVPNLGGRIVEWHAAGCQWLAPANPANQWLAYPANEGCCAFVIQGMYSYQAWSEKYAWRRTKDGMRLWLDLGDGLRLERRYALRDGKLHIDSRLENRGKTTIRAAWGGSLHLLAPDWQTISWTGTQLDAATVPEGLDKALVLEGERLPPGELTTRLGSHCLRWSFTLPPVTRLIVGRDPKQGSLALDLRTPEQPLAPSQVVVVRETVSMDLA